MKIAFSKHRIEALSDGLFAIVMTLLVLDVRVPELSGHGGNERVFTTLRTVAPNLGVFALTFLLASAFWFQHHVSMQPIRSMTRPLLWINLVCLMFVSLLPFSASLLMRNISASAAQMFYYGNMLAIGLGLALQWAVANRMKLIAEDADRRLLTRLNARIWLIPVASAGAIAGAALGPSYAAFGFMLGVIGVRVAGVRYERARR